MELNHSLRCSCCEACLLNFISMQSEDQNRTLKIMPMYLKWSKWKMGSNFHHSSSLGFICASNNACWFSIPKLKANFQCQWWLGFFSLLCRKISSLRQNLDLIICYKIKTSTFFALRSAHGFPSVFFLWSITSQHLRLQQTNG